MVTILKKSGSVFWLQNLFKILFAKKLYYYWYEIFAKISFKYNISRNKKLEVSDNQNSKEIVIRFFISFRKVITQIYP